MNVLVLQKTGTEDENGDEINEWIPYSNVVELQCSMQHGLTLIIKMYDMKDDEKMPFPKKKAIGIPKEKIVYFYTDKEV